MVDLVPTSDPDLDDRNSGQLLSELEPPPAYYPPVVQVDTSLPGPPPSYAECLNLNVPPPSYESLFGRVRDVQKSSSGFFDFLKNVVILLLGTVGCTLMIGITLVIPLFMIVIGSLKMDECPVERFIPIYLVVGGAFGVVKNILSFNSRLRYTAENNGDDERNMPWHRRLNLTSLISCFLLGWFITGCVWIYRVYEPNYVDHEDPRYCDFTLYQFAFWLVTSVYIAFGLLTTCMCCLSVATILMQQDRLSSQV